MITRTMSSLAALAIVIICMGSASVLLPETAMAGSSKVEVCHLPPGNPDSFHTIKISDNALSAHFNNHGDLGGPCDANCEELCDDGNLCTSPAGECSDGFCPDQVPKDCEDGFACTDNSCNTTDGSCEAVDTCGADSVCDTDITSPTAGQCVTKLPEFGDCPCFDLPALLDELVANGGNLSQCGEVVHATGTGVEVLFNNGNYACAGDGGAFCFANQTTLCGQYDQTVSPWNPNFPVGAFTTTAEDTACRDMLTYVCDLVVNPSAPATSSAADDSGTEVTVPPVLELQ